MKIILLKEYQNNKAGKVMTVDRKKATSLVSQGIAEFFVQTVKTNFGETKALKY